MSEGSRFDRVTQDGDQWRLVAFVPGVPIAKARPRLTRSGRAYTPKATHEAERRIRRHLDALVPPEWPMDTGYIVTLAFVMGSRRRVDVDNMAKLVLDACNGELWDDDRQVHTLRAYRYQQPGDAPFTMISVDSCEPMERILEESPK